MGFRTTFTSEDYYLPLPKWFVKKYKGRINMYKNSKGNMDFPISSVVERKFYDGKDDELFIDLQKVLNESKETRLDDFQICLFHECGGITKVHIGGDFIRFYEPRGEWIEVDDITHDYCYGCSDPKEYR